MDISSAVDHYRKFCKALDINLEKPDTVDTPSRVVKMFVNDFTLANWSDAGMHVRFTKFPVNEAQRNQLVVVAGTSYVSMCAHHHVPFVGHAHVCYLPNEHLAGLSKIVRAVQWVAKKPTVQEDLVRDILDMITEELSPKFAGVSLSGQHGCMAYRGVREPGSLTINNAFYVDPNLKSDDEEKRSLTLKDFDTTKQEFMQSIDHWFKYQHIQ